MGDVASCLAREPGGIVPRPADHAASRASLGGSLALGAMLAATRPRTPTIRRVCDRDAATWVRLRAALCPAQPMEAHALHVARFFWTGSDETVAYLAECMGAPIGFIELSLRDRAEGCEAGRIAYVEGWYVAPAWRTRGVGGVLLAAGERWARASGCREIATHVPLDPPRHVAASISSASPLPPAFPAHAALGFTEVSRIACLRKALATDPR